MFRHLSNFVVGAAAFVCFGIAAYSQLPSGSAAKPVSRILPPYTFYDGKFVDRLNQPEPEPCFCTGKCLDELRGIKPPLYVAWRSRFGPTTSDVRVIDLDGLKKLLQRDPKDSRPLLINFWATWCDPCREEFPDLVKIDADYRPKSLNFVAISLDDVTDIKTAVPQFLK